MRIKQYQRGLTMIELMIGLTIFTMLLLLGAPSFSAWIQSSHIRNSAESIQNGLTLARAEAVRRNVTVNFQLVDTLTSSCVVSTSGGNWVVSRGNAAAHHDHAPGVAQLPHPGERRCQCRQIDLREIAPVQAQQRKDQPLEQHQGQVDGQQ